MENSVKKCYLSTVVKTSKVWSLLIRIASKIDNVVLSVWCYLNKYLKTNNLEKYIISPIKIVFIKK